MWIALLKRWYRYPESLRQNTVLYVVGQDKPKKFAALAERSGVGTNVHFLRRNDINGSTAAAVTFTASSLSSGSCWYCFAGSHYCWFAGADNRGAVGAHYIVDANCGEAMTEPFRRCAK